jgi:hypothetical protein
LTTLRGQKQQNHGNRPIAKKELLPNNNWAAKAGMAGKNMERITIVVFWLQYWQQ